MVKRYLQLDAHYHQLIKTNERLYDELEARRQLPLGPDASREENEGKFQALKKEIEDRDEQIAALHGELRRANDTLKEVRDISFRASADLTAERNGREILQHQVEQNHKTIAKYRKSIGHLGAEIKKLKKQIKAREHVYRPEEPPPSPADTPDTPVG